MISRSELKATAKQAIRRNMGMCILAAFIIGLIPTVANAV